MQSDSCVSFVSGNAGVLKMNLMEKYAMKFKTIQAKSPSVQPDPGNERSAILENDGGLSFDLDKDNTYGIVEPLQLIYAEPCGKQTPPKGDCSAFKWKLRPDTRDLNPWCNHSQKWCLEITFKD